MIYLGNGIYSKAGDYLQHHGVEGQHWGVKNGPPYPIGKTNISKNKKTKEDKKLENARNFCADVRKLADKYGVSFFVVTEGASAVNNNGSQAVKNARDNHIKWELNNNSDPYEDWGSKHGIKK